MEDKVAVELSPAEAKIIGQMRGEIPPDPHPHQELIDEREAKIRDAGKAYDESRLLIMVEAEEKVALAKRIYDLLVTDANQVYHKEAAAKNA